MDLLITILRAAHCRSTHHFFVIDALPMLSTERGRRLKSVLLKHHSRYLAGAKHPDTKFRDFRNHVVHVNDGYWGGAPKKAETWYQNLLDDLDAKQWARAAYSAGVLSHYFTDPLMPLHTAQSKIESVVHRPMEWSVTKSYQRIFSRWQEGHHKIVFDVSSDAGWLAHTVRRGAKVANRYYDDLIAHYDLEAGVRKPTSGFDDKSIDILAGLFGLAITGWAEILNRAAEQTRSEIPELPLTAASLLATIKMPVAWITRRIEFRREREAVQAIFDEYKAKGRVERNKPAEVQAVAVQRRRDLERQRENQRIEQQNQQGSGPPPTVAATAGLSKPEPQPAARPIEPTATRIRRRPSLSSSDNLVDAPSIGPKTAKRFAAIGINTVEQFLAANPDAMESALNTSWITTQKLIDWQAQARLVCRIPSLCGYKSQLLVGIGCNTPEKLAGKTTAGLHKELVRFAETAAGKRILRSSKTPGINDVKKWITEARERSQTKRSA